MHIVHKFKLWRAHLSMHPIYTSSLTCVLDGFQCVSGMLQLCVRCNIEGVQISSYRRVCQEKPILFCFLFRIQCFDKVSQCLCTTLLLLSRFQESNVEEQFSRTFLPEYYLGERILERGTRFWWNMILNAHISMQAYLLSWLNEVRFKDILLSHHVLTKTLAMK